LKEHDLVAKIHFCNWFLQVINCYWFSLMQPGFPCGEVNSENYKYWGAENPGRMHTLSLFMTKQNGAW
jgi:hypothetical protein